MDELFSKRLSELIKNSNYILSDMEEAVGKKAATISRYATGEIKGVKRSTIVKLADFFGVNPAWLAGLSDDKYRNQSNDSIKYYMCPVYGEISAGQPNWAEENIEGRLPIDINLMNIVNPEEHFFLRVNGESMNKVIKNGAFALIHKQDTVNNGEIAVVLVNGYNATLKRFSKEGDIIVLTPESTDESIKQQIYTKDTPIKVIGKYVGKMELN